VQRMGKIPVPEQEVGDEKEKIRDIVEGLVIYIVWRMWEGIPLLCREDLAKS